MKNFHPKSTLDQIIRKPTDIFAFLGCASGYLIFGNYFWAVFGTTLTGFLIGWVLGIYWLSDHENDKKTKILVQFLNFENIMAKNNGLDFDFGKEFGELKSEFKSLFSIVANINENVANIDKKFTTKFENLEIRADGLEKYKSDNDINIKWICRIGVVCFTIITVIFTFGTGIAQNVLSEVAKSSIIKKQDH